jgi:hypothetical protein
MQTHQYRQIIEHRKMAHKGGKRSGINGSKFSSYFLLLLCKPHHHGHLLLQVADDVCVNFADAHSLHQLVDLAYSTAREN